MADNPDILCGLVFKHLPNNHIERTVTLGKAEETLRISYKMVEELLSLKEEEERADS